MNRKHIAVGITGSGVMSAVYFTFLLLIGGLEHTLEFLSSLWFWLLIIVSGFGIQLGLFSYIKSRIKLKSAQNELSLSAGVSAGAMTACCLHLLVNVLPILGFSALAVFFLEFQLPVILIGVFSNILGVLFLLAKIKGHKLFQSDGSMRVFALINYRYAVSAVLLFAFTSITLTAVQANIRRQPAAQENIAPEKDYETLSRSFEALTRNSNRVTFEAVPKIDETGRIVIALEMNTHSVNLNFNMLESAVLIDREGAEMAPSHWTDVQGSGHHISGTLLFPYSIAEEGRLLLLVQPDERFEEMRFEWKLP